MQARNVSTAVTIEHKGAGVPVARALHCAKLQQLKQLADQHFMSAQLCEPAVSPLLFSLSEDVQE